MADQKISELTAITTPLQDADFMHIIDNGTTTNKKITLGNLFGNIPGLVRLTATPAVVTSGAIDVTTPISYVSTTSAQTYGLADAPTNGQLKILVQTVNGGGTDVATITPTNLTGGTSITMNAVGENCVLIFVNSGWNILSLGGGTGGVATVI